MTMSPTPRISPLLVPKEDLQRCHELLGPSAWQSLAGQKIFMTGGTGFVGKWLLATLLDADAAFNLECRITVLSRNPASFLKDWPAMAGRVAWITGDVRDFRIGSERQDVIIHAATDVAAQPSPQEVFDTCIEGTRQVLALARESGARRLLLLSSGAVYGPLPPGMTHVPETHLGAPDPLSVASAYGEGKRVSELLVAQAGLNGLDVHIARLFAAVGPHLPLDKHFAIGNFLRAAINGNEIVVNGDGTPHRSYLYAADMSAWIWAVLFRGLPGRAYNVGSDESISISNLARRVCQVLDRPIRLNILQVAKPGVGASHYVPNVSRAQTELALSRPLRLDEAIARAAIWYHDRLITDIQSV
jgi:nucleoside-diphosphate-sugar epimerase